LEVEPAREDFACGRLARKRPLNTHQSKKLVATTTFVTSTYVTFEEIKFSQLRMRRRIRLMMAK
jgi:hypothetical protein